jgi:hypothetical protein
MFLDVSGWIAHNPPARHYGVAVFDADGDGADEFFVAGFDGPNRVLKWVNGELRDVAPPALADAYRQALGVAAGDLDGDGREELYVLNTDSFAGPKHVADRLFDAQPDGGWLDLFSQAGNRAVRNLASGRSVAAIDRRGTGRYGFFVANYGAPMRLYELGRDDRLADRAASLGLDLVTGGRGVCVGPLASERSDLLCVNEYGPNFLFRNQGDGTFREVAADCGLTDAGEHARGVAVLDADGDGRLDLCWGNWDGPHRLMLRQVNGCFRDRATLAMALPSAVRTVVAADFDNDGRAELFFNNVGEPNRLFRAGDDPPEWRLADLGAAAEPTGLGTGAAVADIDGDGHLELLVAHGESAPQPLGLFKCAGGGDNWLRIRPRTRFGAPARGAVVRLSAGARTQVRVIDGGSGYLCQMEPVAHFGLGDAERVDSINITWPDGSRQTLDRPATGRTLDVPHPDT